MDDIEPNVAKNLLERLFTEETIDEVLFSPMFLARRSIARVQQTVEELKANLGSYEAVEEEGERYVVVFSHSVIPTTITLTEQSKISTLQFLTPRSRVSSLDEALAQFTAFAGVVSVLVLEDGHDLVKLNAERPLAVGSAFKLAVLAALKQQIDSGDRSWRDVVALQSDWKSLPSGFLQDWPDTSPLTVFTLAALMIARSDNTATDALIHLVGREAVEQFAPRNQPLLTTREAFILKDPRNEALLERYRSENPVERRLALERARACPLPETDLFADGPRAPEAEWFFAAHELCKLMEQVADLPLLGINPGVVNPKEWSHICYKGGREPGVLNFTHRLVSAMGQTYCVVATWNDAAVLNETKFLPAYGGLVEVLRLRSSLPALK